MSFTVFYAWQSDRNEQICRYFVRDALKRSLKKLKADASVKDAPSLDHDTKNEPGTPHIAQSIEKKIKQCGLFLADLTPVARYRTDDGREKTTPNSNVLIELGIAVRSVGWKRIILVMNDAFGSPDNLPFDIKHRTFPITFSLESEGTTRASVVKQDLSRQIAEKIRIIMDSHVIEDAFNRRVLNVTVTCQVERHVRFLCVDVKNERESLNDFRVVLEFPSLEHAETTQSHQLASLGSLPNPFQKGFTSRFTCPNQEPHNDIGVLNGVPPESINLRFFSNIREVLRVPATKWLKALDEFRLANPSLPAPPPPPGPERTRAAEIDMENWPTFRKW